MSNNAAHSNNSYQRGYTEKQELQAFDALPRAVKRALHAAEHPYSAVWILDRLNRGTSVKTMIADIQQSDRTNIDLTWKAAIADLGRQVARIKADIMTRLVGRRRIR
jgi:hypothetical protein